MIKFSNGISNDYLDIKKLDDYLQHIANQNGGYIIFGQKGNRRLTPNNASDLSSLIKIKILNKSDQADYKILSDNNNSELYNVSPRA